MTGDLLMTLRTCADEIGAAVTSRQRQGFSGQRATQYHLDIVADEVARRVLVGAGLRVVSEESGVSGVGDVTVVVDPIDGSTNCDRGIPFYATSLAVLSGEELVAGLVANQATGTVFAAEKGSGATRDGQPIRTSGRNELSQSIIGFSGLASRHLGWAQCRALGAASLEICLVADGSLDLFTVAQRSTLNTWDYLAGLLVLQEAGGVVGDYDGAALVSVTPVARRPIFAAGGELLKCMLEAGPL